MGKALPCQASAASSVKWAHDTDPRFKWKALPSAWVWSTQQEDLQGGLEAQDRTEQFLLAEVMVSPTSEMAVMIRRYIVVLSAWHHEMNKQELSDLRPSYYPSC